MEGVDPDTLLEWLQTGVGEERDLQLMALEQLCMTLLMSDNIDRCFEICPPRTFLPALGRIFLDETTTENILEVTARAITYYLDVSNECTRRITQVEGVVKAICHRLIIVQMTDRTSRDLAEQCVKLLEHICQREASAVYDAGGLQAMLHLIKHHDHLHKDTMHSAMAVVTKLCSKIEPNDSNLAECSKDLGDLLGFDDERVAECALRCFAAMTDRFLRRQMDPAELARPSNLVTHLFDLVGPSVSLPQSESEAGQGPADPPVSVVSKRNSAFISTVLSLFANLCKTSSTITEEILSSAKLIPTLKTVLSSKDERCINDCLRFIDLLIVLLFEGRASIPKSNTFANDSIASPTFDKIHRNLIDAIRLRDTDALIDAVENGTVDPDFVDDVGQTLLNWCSAFGTSDMVIYLCDKGADPNKGQRSTSLHYAACFGRLDIVKILLRYGANPDIQDEEGRTALDKARERSDEGHQQVCELLQNPGAYINIVSNTTTAVQKHSTNQAEAKTNTEKEKIYPKLGEKFIQQLLPLFCIIYKNSMAVGVRRATLLLIRKCVFHIPAEALGEITELKEGEENISSTRISGLVESLVGVLLLVFESSESNTDAKEQALMTIKSLLMKNAEFWAEQLIRLGVYEKIEQLAKDTAQMEGTSVVVSSMDPPGQPSELKSSSRPTHIMASYSADNKKESSEEKLGVGSFDRSEASTPSMSLRSDSTAPSELYSAINEQTHYSNDEIVVHADSATPSPTVELIHTRQASTSPPEEEPNVIGSRDENSPAFDSDLVEAAETIANALGVQIVQDAADPSEQTAPNGAKDGSEDVWTLEERVFYRWKDWRLIRTKDSSFIWCDAIALELSDASNGWLRFLMNGRLSTLYSSGSPEYGADNADTRADFIDKMHKAKAAVPSGAQTKSILSVPRSASQTIKSGNWNLASVEAGTVLVTNREGTQQKLTIKEELPGFMFETSRHHKQLFTADSTLGHDFVTGWAARGGGRRLRYFRLEVQKQKVFELARDIWENHLRKARDKPREIVLQVQKCSNVLSKLSNTLASVGIEKVTDYEKVADELRKTLVKIRDTLIDESVLSVFEISISGLVPSLLEFFEKININRNGILAKCFAEIFFDAKHLAILVHKIVMVLEFIEKFPQCLFDAPGGSPFGLQLLARRLRFRFELSNQDSDAKDVPNEFVDLTNRSLKSEPLVTVAALRTYLYEHITNSKPKEQAKSSGPSSSSAAASAALAHLNFGRPPTAASLARKLPKATADKSGGGTAPSAGGNKQAASSGGTQKVMSARSAYVAAGCVEKVGGNIKVKQPTGSGKTATGAKGVAAKKAGGVMSARNSSKPLAKAQRSAVSAQQKDLSSSAEKPTNEPSGGNGNSMGEKSMSTTNLFDPERLKARSASVAFNQAASAESLQHQTPSLENLLSKARLRDYSIPEESMGSPTNAGSPEPKNLPTFENLSGFETRFEKRKGSEDAQNLTIGASSFAGGSQPVLNSSSFSRDRSQVSSAEKLEATQIESSIETINEVSQKAEDEGANQFADEQLIQFQEEEYLQPTPKKRISTSTAEEYSMELDREEEEDEGEEDEEGDGDELIPGIKETENLFNLLAEGASIDEGTLIEVDESAEKGAAKKKKGTKGSESAGENATTSSKNKGGNQQHAAPGTSSTGSGNPSSQIQNIGSNIRVKLGNYAEVLRNMMQQVLENGDNSDIYDVEEFDNDDIYDINDDDEPIHFIECADHPGAEHGHGFSISSDSSSITGRFADHPHPPPPGGAGTTAPANPSTTASTLLNDATSAFQSQIDSFTSVASALRRQFSSSSNSSNQPPPPPTASANVGGSSRAAVVAALRAAMERNENIISSIPIEAIIGAHGGNGNESRHHQRWRQVLLDEFGHAHLVTHGTGEGGKHRDCGAGCARTMRTIAGRGATSTAQTGGWNDDFVLRKQFGALIPAFDPRPGRTNVNQTQDVELPENIQFGPSKRRGSLLCEDSDKSIGTSSNASSDQSRTMRLFIKKGSKDGSKSGGEEVLVELKDEEASLFQYVQQLLLANQKSDSCSSEINPQIWDRTFTLVYENPSKNLIDLGSTEEVSKPLDESVLSANPLVAQALNVIRLLNELTRPKGDDNATNGAFMFPSLPEETFHSTKLTQKLCQELTDALVVSAKTIPDWCTYLVRHFPCLFSMDTRIMYMNTTAFGTSRAIGYLQSRRDQMLDQNRSATASAGSNMAGLRREDHYPEYRIGRVKHERIKVHRSEELFLENAIKVLKFHAMRKAILEIEYHGEEGTGLGPTLEFFALVSAEFQRKDLCLWHCEDTAEVAAEQQDLLLDLEPNPSAPGYYVHSPAGLFPAPWPTVVDERVLELFQIFGVFMAKAIQDNRCPIDLPLSKPFIKLITSPMLASGEQPSIESVLGFDDFALIYPEKAKLVRALLQFVERRRNIQFDENIDIELKEQMVDELRVDMDGTEFAVEDLSLTFAVNAPAKCFPYTSVELIEDGASVEVDSTNVEEYVRKLLEFHLDKGIRQQILAFRQGFDMVFPLSSLVPFSAGELLTFLSGEQCPKWTREDLLRYTDPKLGYTRDSAGFLNFVDVLVNFDASERKAFLQFTTGCSSLPPGGLANLHPRLTIVRKVGSGDGSYPSVNTCVHYLKLPEYSSAQILRERLLAATREKGFHLN